MSDKKYGVLLVNLGTPTEPTASAVRRFLREFLSDKRVVDLPRLIWLPILYGVILNFRPKKVARNYLKIWTEQGSPLMLYSRQQQTELQNLLANKASCQIKVELGMTYGSPSIQTAVDALKNWGADEIVVLPLYPQFSHTTTSSVFDQTELLEASFGRKFKVISDYFDEPFYIDALARSIESKMSGVDKLVISFHGIPKRYVEQGDPYQSQCETTAKLLAKRLNLTSQQWELAYQSRMGKEEWLRPYLDHRMTQLADEGVRKILVVCPGFSADCLETLEEISLQNKQCFIQHGGQDFEYIEALNAEPAHIKMMAELVTQKIN